MGKYTIDYQCGCSETIQLYGPTSERDRKVAAMEKQECPACHARKANDGSKGAILEGSPKQILWALDIRDRLLDEIDCLYKFIDNDIEVTEAQREQRRHNVSAVEKWLKSRVSSKDFIDKLQYKSALALVKIYTN